MRDIILVSESHISIKNCIKSISQNIPWCRINGENALAIEKPYSLFLDCTNDCFSSIEADSFSAEEIEKIRTYFNGNKLFLSDINYHRSTDAKRIISELIKEYPKLFVIVEDEEEWLGTAEEYLTTEFPY